MRDLGLNPGRRHQQMRGHRRRDDEAVSPARRQFDLSHADSHGPVVELAALAGDRRRATSAAFTVCLRRRCGTPRPSSARSQRRCSRTSSSTRSIFSRITTRSTRSRGCFPGKFPNLLVNGSRLASRSGWRRRCRLITWARSATRSIAYIDNPTIDLDSIMELLARPGFSDRCHAVRADGHQGSVHDRPRPGRRSAPSTRSKSSRTAGARSPSRRSPISSPRRCCSRSWPSWCNAGRITGVSNVDDFSDRKQPVRIAVTVKKGEDPNVIVNQLFEYSPLQDTFSMIMLALVNGRPRTLPLLELLRLFIEHRINVIRRRTQHQLRQARQRAHIIEGLLIALAYIDEIIRVIRSSANPAEARTRLMGIAVSAEILKRSAQRPRGQGIDRPHPKSGRRHPLDAVAAIDGPRGGQARAGIRRPQGKHASTTKRYWPMNGRSATWSGLT